MPDAPQNAQDIAQRLWPRITTTEAKWALNLLAELGMLKQTDDATLRAQEDTLETPAQVKSLAVRNYHRDMLQRAAASLDTLPTTERSVTSIALKLTPKELSWVNSRISEFQDELLSSLQDARTSANEAEIYNIAFSAIPVTRRNAQ